MAFKFLKTGAASKQMAEKAAAEAEQRKSETGKMFRFRLKDKEEAKITFIDGALATEGPLAGVLDQPRFYEHNLYQQTKGSSNFSNFYVCPERTNPDAGEMCPICASGDRAAFVALFTVIDHRQFTSRDGSKVYKNQRRLLVAKPTTYELLLKQAMKRGGLAGCTFEVSRLGDKSAAVGSVFDFVEKQPVEELKKLFVVEVVDPATNKKKAVTNFVVADYEKEISYHTGNELAVLVGAAKKGGGASDEEAEDDIPFEGAGSKAAPDYSDQL